MKKKWIWVLVVAGILIALRIALPFILKNYVNKTLHNLDGYTGSVQDVDLALFRGAYVIDSLNIEKTGDSIPVPFIDIARIDLSVHWKALFDGAVVGEVVMADPEVNFAEVEGEAKQDGKGADWTETLKNLMPLKINRFEVENGKISFRDFSTNPKVDVFIDNLNLVATNLTNVESKEERLPSTLTASGSSLGGGHLNIDAKMNILKKVPDLDLDLTFEDVELTALNDFIKAYTHTDVEEGTFNLYSEIIIDDSKLDGYVKPVLENLKIIDLAKEKEGFLQKTWELIVAGVTELFENQRKEQLATEVPLTGNLNNLQVGIVPTIWNVFKNAFVEALSKRIDNTIEFNE